MGEWLNSIISDQLANLVVGWITAIPIEFHFIGAVGAALIVWRFLGWPGTVLIGMGLAYVLGLKRVGVEVVLPKPPVVEDYEREIAPAKPKRPSLLDKIRLGLSKGSKQ